MELSLFDSAREERGSLAPLGALLVIVCAGLSMGVARIGAEASRAAQARSAADAAALAGAGAGESAARQVALDNGARLVSFLVQGNETQVVITLADQRVSARAAAKLPLIASNRAIGLHPELRRALAQAESILGVPVPITSGWRSKEQQQRLYDQRGTNPYPVARPGNSRHEQGLAIDVPLQFVDHLARVAPQVGLCRPVAQDDPIHFELCRQIPTP